MVANSEHHSSLCGPVLLHQFLTPGSRPSSSNDGLWYGIIHQINPILSKFLLVRMFYQQQKSNQDSGSPWHLSLSPNLHLWWQGLTAEAHILQHGFKSSPCSGWKMLEKGNKQELLTLYNKSPEHQEHHVTQTDLSVGWMCLRQVTGNTKSILWRDWSECMVTVNDVTAPCVLWLWHQTSLGTHKNPRSEGGTSLAVSVQHILPSPVSLSLSVMDAGLSPAIFCPLCFSTNFSSLCAFRALAFGYSGYYQLSSILLNFFLTT